MGNTFFFDWEVRLMEWLQTCGGNFGTMLAAFLTEFGEELVLVLIIGFLYWSYDKKVGKFVGINVAVGTVANPLVKNVFLRRRPYFDHDSIQCLKPVDADADVFDIAAQGYSFPSGHSQNAAIAYPSIAIKIKHNWVRIVAILLPILVGVSRFFLGVHYPTDVLAGWALGILLVVVMTILQTKIKHQGYLYIALTVLGALGFLYCTSNDFYTGYGLMTGFFLGFTIEEKVVRFENTRNVIRAILRVLCGAGLFLFLNKLLKLPFPEHLLDGATFVAHLLRSIRYCVASCLVTGVYPMLFKITASIGKKGE